MLSSFTIWTLKREGGTKEFDILPVTTALRSALLSLWEKRQVISEYVFVNLDKTPFVDKYYGIPFQQRQHFMKKLCEKAEVKPFGFHAIRHLTASILYHSGESVATVQQILRHKSPNTTSRYLKTL